MHIKVAFLFMWFAVIISVHAETVGDAGVAHGLRSHVLEQIRRIKSSDLSEKDKSHSMSLLRQRLGVKYKRNHQEMQGMRDVYETEKEMEHKLKNLHVGNMKDGEKKETIRKLQDEFTHDMEEIEHVMSIEQKEQQELKHVFKKFRKMTDETGEISANAKSGR
ncbi:uncharacterized protein [Antedon mediterranea]|uniref:uncharacterized protein n=1 Tax=Antedon mediterranea TaxID=105859 RepID=UPI003AF7CF3F